MSSWQWTRATFTKLPQRSSTVFCLLESFFPDHWLPSQQHSCRSPWSKATQASNVEHPLQVSMRIKTILLDHIIFILWTDKQIWLTLASLNYKFGAFCEAWRYGHNRCFESRWYDFSGLELKQLRLCDLLCVIIVGKLKCAQTVIGTLPEVTIKTHTVSPPLRFVTLPTVYYCHLMGLLSIVKDNIALTTMSVSVDPT